MSSTLNFGITLLDPNQAQKDVTVNTALVVLDGFVQPSVISAALTSAPTLPNDQDKYIVPAGATGVWAGQTNNIAVYQANGSSWSFFTPKNGWLVVNQALGVLLSWSGSAWTVLATVSTGTGLGALSSLTAAQGQQLANIAALTPTNGNVIAGNGTTWVSETAFAAFGVQAAMMAIIYGG